MRLINPRALGVASTLSLLITAGSYWWIAERAPSDYSRRPVLLVHGHGLGVDGWDPLIAALVHKGYPREYLNAVAIEPNMLGNIEAAERFIAPAAAGLLRRAATAAVRASGENTPPEDIVIIGHSMGSVSSRWYASKISPMTTAVLISLTGANHGTNALCGFKDAGSLDMCPAFAESAIKSRIQVELNGTRTQPVDETPYGFGTDRDGINRVPPTATKAILYLAIGLARDDWITPTESAWLDGAGGQPLPVPASVSEREHAPGNYVIAEALPHDLRLQSLGTELLIDLLLGIEAARADLR